MLPIKIRKNLIVRGKTLGKIDPTDDCKQFFCLSGTFKYGLYEVFKNVYAGFMGEENAYKYRTAMYLVSKPTKTFKL
jgi:hypothetical protein